MSRFYYKTGCTLKCFSGRWNVEDYYGANHAVLIDDLLHILGVDQLRNNKDIIKIMLIRKGTVHKNDVFIEASVLDDYIGKGHFMFVDTDVDIGPLAEGSEVEIPKNNEKRFICFWCGKTTKKLDIFTSVVDYCPACDK